MPIAPSAAGLPNVRCNYAMIHRIAHIAFGQRDLDVAEALGRSTHLVDA